MLRTVALAACAVVSACGAPAPPDGPIGRTSSAIVGGVASTAAQNFVVQVVHPIGGAEVLCSGSLVAPNLVLTARHCVSVTPDQGFACDEGGNGTDGGTIGDDYAVSSIFIYTGVDAPSALTKPSARAVRLFHDDATNVCDHDLALIAIDPPLAALPVAPLDLGGKVDVGELVTAVGWGVTADGASPSARQQLPGLAVLAVGPASNAAGYEVGPNEFDVGQSICDGDSGGPALDPAGAIVGVVSRGGNGAKPSPTNAASTCLGAATVNVYTETAAFKDLILAAFASAGATPHVVETPLGEDCASSAECASGMCAAVAPEAGTTCTEDCARAACPGGFACRVVGTASLCAEAPGAGCAAAGEASDAGGVGWALAVIAVGAAAAAGRRSRSRSLRRLRP